MEKKYYVSGMHCKACELLIEEKISEVKRLKSAKASAGTGEVLVGYHDEVPSIRELNKLFKEEGYVFSDRPVSGKSGGVLIKGGATALIITGVFYLLSRLGIGDLINVTSGSSFVSFLGLGLIAGVSSCAALVGGLVLALSESWSEKKDNMTFSEKARPHITFTSGRLVSYALFGAALGLIGEKLRFSPVAAGVIVLIASVIMIVTGLKMIGVRIPSLPIGKGFFRSVLNKAEKAKKYTPFISGFLTFFLPCGFTIAAQSAALASGSPIRGGLMMLFFAIGTTPSLFIIGLSGSGMSKNKKRGVMFSVAAGFLLLLFAVFNINSQLNALGFSSLSDLSGKNTGEENKVIAKPVSGVQVIKMDAYSTGYKPNNFTVKAGVPVRWEITDKGTSGCTNAVIARGLFKNQVPLYKGKTSVVEFTPQKAGTYKFSCWMGMIQGTIVVK